MDCVFYRIACTPAEKAAAIKEWERLRAIAVHIRDVEESARAPTEGAEHSSASVS